MLGILQWLGEAINPGPVGTIEFHRPQKKRRKRVVAILRLLFSIGLMLIWQNVLLPEIAKGDGTVRNWLLLGTLGYLVASYFIHPKPDYQNLGLFWGLIDNPFRMSDNLNRWLVTLEVILMPGSFVAVSVVEFIELIIYSRKKSIL
jgi:hypothetical protein